MWSRISRVDRLRRAHRYPFPVVEGLPGPLTVGGLTWPVLEDHGATRTARALGAAITRWITARTVPQPRHGSPLRSGALLIRPIRIIPAPEKSWRLAPGCCLQHSPVAVHPPPRPARCACPGPAQKLAVD